MSIRRYFFTILMALPAISIANAAPQTHPADGKLKIFILSGQSNMVGFGQVKGDAPGTMEAYVKSNPKDYGHLVDGKGEPVVRDDVWIVDLSYPDKQRQGWLTTGYGANADTSAPNTASASRSGTTTRTRFSSSSQHGAAARCSHNFLPPSAGNYPKPEKDGDAGFQYAEIAPSREGDHRQPEKVLPGLFRQGLGDRRLRLAPGLERPHRPEGGRCL